MKNEFVPYEIALAMKELGFNELCFSYYDYGILEDVEFYKEKDNGHVIAPLYQQAFKWFRKKYNMYCPIMPADLGKYEEGNPDFQAGIYTREPVDVESLNTFKTYEEAELACLKKLIEIINQNKDEKQV